ncbi:MAG: HlyD family efflux transporter periplasmic adaptor subunit [Armatimonadia bacterium]|nr:HlyD family efflux transporter periplasmic adaptor subunit [Armatimonadia bacterium]
MDDMNQANGPRLRAQERPEVVKRRRRRRITWAVVIVVVIGGGVWWTMQKRALRALAEQQQWEERVVELADVEVVVSERGIVEPLSQVIVKSQVAAEVREILVEEGDEVTEGDVIAHLDESRVQQDVDNRAAQVDSALAGVERASLVLSQTRDVSQAQLTSARAAVQSAEAALSLSIEGQRPEEIVQAEQRVAQREADLRAAEAQLEELRRGFRPQEIAEQEMAVAQAASQLSQARESLTALQQGNRPQEIEQARARLRQAEMSQAAAQASLRKLRAGNRPQEIAQARAELSSATAQLDEAEATLSRQVELKDAGYASAQAVDTARASYLAARAQVESRRQALDLLQEGSRSEDIAAAEADLARAEASTEAAQEELELLEAGPRAEDIEQQRQAVRAAEATLASQEARLSMMVEGTREEQIRQQEQAVRRSEAALQEAEAGLRVARLGSREQEITQAASSLTDAEAGLDQAEAGKLDAAVRAQDIVDARAQLQSARTQLLRAQEDLQDCTVRAPMGGIVLSRHVEPGELAASGTTGLGEGTPLVTVGDTSRLVVKLQVHEVDVVNLRTGLAAEIRFDAIQGEVFDGTVLEIAPQSTAVSQEQAAGRTEGPAQAGVVTFEVKIVVDSGDGRIRPGMSAGVKVICDSVSDVPTVTLAALHSEDDQTYVLTSIPPEGGEPVRQEVELGMRGASIVEIESGLQAGDTYLIKKPETTFEFGPGG